MMITGTQTARTAQTVDGSDTEVIRVLIVEDHAMLAEGLRVALETQPDLVVVEMAATLQDGLAAVAQTQPDVVLMDKRLPDGDGVDAAAGVRGIAPQAAVLVITAEIGPHVVLAALESGCAGLMAKGSTVMQLTQGIRDVHAGEGVFSQEMLAAALRPKDRTVESLTERELEVLRLLDAGSATEQIASELVLSRHTVRNHIRNLTAKLGANSRLQAVARAREQGLLGVTVGA